MMNKVTRSHSEKPLRKNLNNLPLGRSKFEAELGKLESEREKLLLERRSLVRQLSWVGEVREWLKAATVPAALVGVIVTFLVGAKQVHEIQENRSSDRFDKALARLASANIRERMTGVSGLQMFLSENDTTRKEASLLFLVGSMAAEVDAAAQDAILNVFRTMDVDNLPTGIADSALNAAIARNRAIFTTAIAEHFTKLTEAERSIVVKSLNVNPQELDGPFIPEKHLSALTIDHLRSLLSVKKSPLGQISADNLKELSGLASIITTLVRKGAKSSDFRNIFCENCDFTSAKNLPKADFSGSFLKSANFSAVNLSESSFRDADIGGALFFGADLTKSDLSQTSRADTPAETSQLVRNNAFFPVLVCSKLQGANLSGQVFLWVDRKTTF